MCRRHYDCVCVCVGRRQSKLRLALSCVEKALALEESVEGVTTLADTHLNLCVLLSLLARWCAWMCACVCMC